MKRSSILFGREPRWWSSQGLQSRKIPDPVHSWLWEPGSLTRRLRSACCGAFRVNLTRQTWGKPFAGESRGLRLQPSRYALIREVELQCNSTSLVLARTIIPAATLKGIHRRLSRLGNRPLGEVIFSDPSLVRLDFSITCVDPDNWTSEQISEGQRVWGRRSRYSVGGGELFVCEFFLPALYVVAGHGDD